MGLAQHEFDPGKRWQAMLVGEIGYHVRPFRDICVWSKIKKLRPFPRDLLDDVWYKF